MESLLAGDIGGTKTILRLVARSSDRVARPAVVGERRYASADFSDLVPMVRSFLESVGDGRGAPAAACFAVAGPVVEGVCRVTNLPWVLAEERLAAELGMPRVRLINDFVAVAWGVPGLEPADLVTLQTGEHDPAAPVGVIGAGTGLGEAFLVPVDGGFHVFPTEGGHTDFAPRSQREFELASYLREVSQIPRVSVERVVSGTGIRSIYEFLRSRDPSAEGAELKRIYAAYEEEIGRRPKTVDLAAEVSRAALEGSDALAVKTMDLFVDAYGAEAGNLALKLLPYGGVYVAGGVVGKIVPLLRAGRFLEAFREKGRMRPLMERIPLHLVTNPKVGLLGAARCAALLPAVREGG
ncbi:MAG: glucokinase [Thermoanaerobaculia bacterium]|nr:glucokinase [Thermoanaerobaculia bacterium]